MNANDDDIFETTNIKTLYDILQYIFFMANK
jgi:hypothetical protein